MLVRGIIFNANGAFIVQRKYRLAKREDFNRVYRFGRSTANRQLVVYVKEHVSEDDFKLGISVSKKIGNAVVRNRMRRLIKEIVRQLEPRISKGIYLVIIVRKPAVSMDYANLEKSVVHLLRKAKILDVKNT